MSALGYIVLLKVGLLIGKGGETIKYLQQHSGAKIQITRDSDANPFSLTRQVELIGPLDRIDKAEQLIKDVMSQVSVLFLYMLVF
jgi:far upstream element-binding protein